MSSIHRHATMTEWDFSGWYRGGSLWRTMSTMRDSARRRLRVLSGLSADQSAGQTSCCSDVVTNSAGVFSASEDIVTNTSSGAAAEQQAMLTSVNFSMGRRMTRHAWLDRRQSGVGARRRVTTGRKQPSDVEQLCRSTRFCRGEVRRYYRCFKQSCPSGIINEDTFCQILSHFFPFGDSSNYSRLIFNMLDKTQSGIIGFDDIIHGLSTLIKGSNEDRLYWAFSLYDINNDGFITVDEVDDVLSCIYEMIEPPSLAAASSKEKALELLKNIDTNEDGLITLEDFMKYCSQNRTIAQSLQAYDEMWS